MSADAIQEALDAMLKTEREEALHRKALAFGKKAAEIQFRNRRGHGGNPVLAERHFTRQQLEVLLAAAFKAGYCLHDY